MELLQMIKSIASQLQNLHSGEGYVDIILSTENFRNRIVFPVVPAELPEIESPQDNTNFEGVLVDLTVMGNLKCKQISWDGLLPSRPDKYSFCRPLGDTATEVISFIKHYQSEFEPLRLTITFSNGATYLNMLVLVNNFKYYRDNVGDYHYTIDLIEYRDVSNNGVLL